MKCFPKILFKRAMILALMVGLITTVLFSAQKANSAGPTSGQTQDYFFCIAGCTKNFTCPLEEDCICNDQPAARSRFVDICKNQSPDEISGACVNCSSRIDPKKPEDSTNCVSYSSGGEHEGWCGCKITCPTPTPTPTPSSSNYCQTQGCPSPTYTGGRYQTSDNLCNSNAGEVLVGNCCCIRSGSSSIPSGYSGGGLIIENQNPSPVATP